MGTDPRRRHPDLTWGRYLPPPVVVVSGLLLAGAVLSAVHHAEVVAHKVGEPFGSLVLAVAVTIIEVALIVTLMISGGDHRHPEPGPAQLHHQPPGPQFSPAQLGFAAVASLALSALRAGADLPAPRLLPADHDGRRDHRGGDHLDPPTRKAALTRLGLPQAVVGVVIALLVLLPETIAAVRAAARDRIQTSHGDEILATLMDCAEPGRRRPAWADVVDVARGAVRQWFRLLVGLSAVVAAVVSVLILGVMGAATGSWLAGETAAELPSGGVALRTTETLAGAPLTAPEVDRHDGWRVDWRTVQVTNHDAGRTRLHRPWRRAHLSVLRIRPGPSRAGRRDTGPRGRNPRPGRHGPPPAHPAHRGGGLVAGFWCGRCYSAGVIRSARVVDAAAVGGLKVRAWRAAYGGFMSPAVLAALDPAREAADWGEYLTDLPAAHRLWIVEAGGAVAGFCRTGPADEDGDLGPLAAEVYGLYLDPPVVGTGLGRRLFSHAVADLRERGRGPICVYAYEPNRTAITFYERFGFRADGVTRLDGQDGVGVAEIRLVLT